MSIRRWRPSHKCLYVIPEIHGNAATLEVILNKILPLRIFQNQEDELIFLGDYIDEDENGNKVIDILINIKQECNKDEERVVFLKGNHEDMMLRAIFGSEQDFSQWKDNSGISTLIGYCKRSGLNINPYSLVQSRLKDIIPKEHIDFLQGLAISHKKDGFFFFHGGFDVENGIEKTSTGRFMYDKLVSKYIKTCIKDGKHPEFKDDYVFVGAHNYGAKEPFIYQRFLALGGSAPNKLMIFDLNSMSMGYVNRGKSRIITEEFVAHE